MTKKIIYQLQKYLQKINNNNINKVDWLIFVAFIVISFIYLTYNLAEEILSGVELAFLYFRFFTEFSITGYITMLLINLEGILNGGHMPLFYIFISPFVSHGLYYPSYMYVSMFFGILTAPLFYLFSRHLFSRLTSILTTFLFISCFHFFHGIREVDEYSIIPFFLLLIMFLFYFYTKSILYNTSQVKHYLLYIAMFLLLPAVLMLHGYFSLVFAFIFTVMILILFFYPSQKKLYIEILVLFFACLYPLHLVLFTYTTVYIPSGPAYFSFANFIFYFPIFLSHLYIYSFDNINFSRNVATTFVLGFIVFLLYLVSYIFLLRNVAEILKQKRKNTLCLLLHFFHRHMFLIFSSLIVLVFIAFTTTSFRVYTYVFLYPLFIFSLGYTIDYFYRFPSRKTSMVSFFLTVFQMIFIFLVLFFSVFSLYINWQNSTYEYHYHYRYLVEYLDEQIQDNKDSLILLENDMEILRNFDDYYHTNYFNQQIEKAYNMTVFGDESFFIFDYNHKLTSFYYSPKLYVVDSFVNGETEVTDFQSFFNESYVLMKTIDFSNYSPAKIFVFERIEKVKNVE